MFRFTIRDVLWLMVVVALACGWYGDRVSQTAMHRQQARIQAELLRAHQAEALRARIAERAGGLQPASE